MPFRNAISGMRAAQVHLETIGNNVANANTTGFKQSRAEFADVYALSQAGIASNNPGNGVNVSRVAQQFSQGSLTVTGNAFDLAIDGDGFFVVEDQGTQVYTRAGIFGLDDEGYVVNAQNQRLIANQPDSAGAISGATGALQLTRSEAAPSATTTMDARVNLDANATGFSPVAIDPNDPSTYNHSSSTTVYDSIGNPHLATMYFAKDSAASNTWGMSLYVADNTTAGAAYSGTMTFDTSGNLTSAMPVTAAATFGTSANPLSVAFDLTGTTQYGSAYSVGDINQNGYSSGRLSGVDIDAEGVVYSRYTNGVSRIEGQIALATFNNPGGLQKLGDNSWGETNASGTSEIGAPGSSDRGYVKSGSLEDSNVDLTAQLVDMIVAQRNFQANAQVITTADSITQTVINIR